jgi:hypothetical protein
MAKTVPSDAKPDEYKGLGRKLQTALRHLLCSIYGTMQNLHTKKQQTVGVTQLNAQLCSSAIYHRWTPVPTSNELYRIKIGSQIESNGKIGLRTP